MGSGVSSESKRRGMKSVNSLKALKRLSLGMNQQQQQQQISHQAVHPYVNRSIPQQQKTKSDFSQRPTRMSLKPTSLNGNATSATQNAIASSKSEEKVAASNPDDRTNGGQVAGDAAAQDQSVTMEKNLPGSSSEVKKDKDDKPEISAAPSGSPKKSEPEEAKVKEIKYTEEEREIKNKEFTDRVSNVLEKFAVVTIRDLDVEGEPYTRDCRNNLLTLTKSYFYFKLGTVPFPFIHQFRQNVSKAMLDHKAIAKMCGIMEDGIVRRTFVNEDGKMDQAQWLPLKNCILALLNYSDVSDDVKIEIGTFSSLFEAIVKLLNDWQQDHMEGKLSDEKNKCLKWCLSICHNVASMEENVPMLREKGVIQSTLAYLDSPVSTMRLGAIATIADMVNEEEAELLQTHLSIFKFIIKMLRNSLVTENHRNLGWSAEELTRAIRQLARNDANKKILVDEGCLPLLVTLINSGNEDERKEAINCLWVLSFKAENKMRMVQEEGLVHCLEERFKGTEDGSLRHACHGILWSLRDQINSPDSPIKVGEAVSNIVKKHTPTSTTKSSSPQFKGHIMVSYQWGNQELIKRIVRELRAVNIPVWLDIDYMGGSTLQAMAQAVEDSAAVIIAMSQKYKDSPNTRAEAEYAFQLRKKIIPLIMQRDYHPDGWLGFILGSKLYYDFSGKHSFESRMEGLLKAVLEVKEGSRNNTPVPELPTVASKKEPSFSATTVLPPVGKPPRPSVDSHLNFDLDVVKKWTTEDKSKWLKKHSMSDFTKLSALQGEEIVFLHGLKLEAPEFFYHCLEAKLGYASILDLAKVASALSDLSV